MAETLENLSQLTVYIQLPDGLDRRLQRWTKKMPGASWPAWGGHITLVPNFVPRVSVEEVRALLESVCVDEEPFDVRFDTPSAVQDSTRPDYYALFLTAGRQEGEEESKLHDLRAKLLTALEPVRDDIHPQLVEMQYLPHVTLALGVGEFEASRMVQVLRADPLVAEFQVEVLWLMELHVGEGARFEHHPIPLGGIKSVELLRD